MLLQTKPPYSRPVAVDVFSGAGGLTVGMKRAGFKVAAAVEIEEHAFATYKTNHPEVHAFKHDARPGRDAPLKGAAWACWDFPVGCPPCQGFSTLTNPSTKRDPRNDLVLEMARLVEEITPRAIMPENVPGLADRGR